MTIANYYNKKALKYNISKQRLHKILELVEGEKNKNILDIGCATGLLAYKLKKQNNHVSGVDISRKAIKQAEKILDEAKVVDLNLEKLPFKAKQFDLIICSEIIEHLFDSANLLNEIKRVIKKNGRVIITTPNILYWGHRINFLKGKFEYQEEGPFDEGHIRFFNYFTMRDKLDSFGFKIINQNHVYQGTNLFDFIKNKFPNIFAYQLVFIIQKR